jgi:ATP-dependent Lhr-like helicase
VTPSVAINPFERLHETVRLWIEHQGWTDFSAIQAAAIPRLLSNEGVLLVAATASGKTEAALLPIVSRIVEERPEPISLLYVAPLRALINDQQRRAELLLREMPLRSAWWHGDLPYHRRRAIMENPPDALLTTPESLEVQLSSDAYGHGAALGNIRYVVVDEIHAFAETERGAQLVSLLARLEALMKRPFLRVALSATIGNPERIASWLASKRPDAPRLEPLVDASQKGRKIGVGILAVPLVNGESKAEHERRAQQRTTDVLVHHLANRRSIIFVRSRSDAELYTMRLRERGIEAYIHHGSLSTEQRSLAEAAFKIDGPKAIIATTSLELGIDIGDLEQVIQLGPVGYASRWLQRLGRSGRHIGVDSVGFLYAERPDELAMALAVCDLAREGTVEPLIPDQGHLAVAFHQVVSLVRERDRLTKAEIIATLRNAGAFDDLRDDEWDDLLTETIAQGFLEDVAGRLQLGTQTERRYGQANYRDFYSVFVDDDGWTVKHGSAKIGELAPSFPVSENRETRFVLAGRWWRVTAVDRKHLVLLVEPVSSGPVPKWAGGGGDASFEVMQRTIAILTGRETALLTPKLAPYLIEERKTARELGLGPRRAVVIETKDETAVVTFAGTRLNAYLAALIGAAAEAGTRVSPDRFALRAGGMLSALDLRQVLERLLTDSVYRSELEETAITRVATALHFKYWPALGPKTRANIARRRFRLGHELERLTDFEITSTAQPQSATVNE